MRVAVPPTHYGPRQCTAASEARAGEAVDGLRAFSPGLQHADRGAAPLRRHDLYEKRETPRRRSGGGAGAAGPTSIFPTASRSGAVTSARGPACVRCPAGQVSLSAARAQPSPVQPSPGRRGLTDGFCCLPAWRGAAWRCPWTVARSQVTAVGLAALAALLRATPTRFPFIDPTGQRG